MADIGQLPLDQMINQSLPLNSNDLFGPLASALSPVLGIISALVGGLFGLYLIYVIFRFYYERKRTQILKDIRFDLDYLNQHYGLPYSQEKITKKVLTLDEYNLLKKKKEKKK